MAMGMLKHRCGGLQGRGAVRASPVPNLALRSFARASFIVRGSTVEQQVSSTAAETPVQQPASSNGNGVHTSEAPAKPAHSVEELQKQIRVGFLAEQGLRPDMEDELHVHWDSKHGALFAACYDGHGGSTAAKWLRENLHSMLSEHLANAVGEAATSSDIGAHIEPAFQAIDDKLLAHLESLGGDDLEHAGATATVLLLWKHRVVVANIGDTQAYLWRKSKEVGLTVPHRVYGVDPEVEEEIERVEATGGWVYDGRVCNVLAVSRAFGDWEFKGKGLPKLLEAGIERGYWPASFIKEINFKSDPVIVTPDTSVTDITEDDEFLVLSTDGLWDVMPPRDAMMWARKELQKGNTPEQVAHSLVHEAMKRQQPQGLFTWLPGYESFAPSPYVTPVHSRDEIMQATAEARKQARAAATDPAVANALVQLALKRHTSDNTSVVVIDLKGADYWKSKKSGSGGGFSFGSLFGR